MTSRLLLLSVGLVAARLEAQAPAARLSIGPNTRVVPGEFSEPWIAASSTNRNVLIAAAHPASNSVTGMDITTMISRDGGRTWNTVPLPGGTQGFDPMVASGPDGRLYVLAGQRSAGYWAWFARMSGVNTALRYPDSKPEHRLWTATGEAWSWDGPTLVPALIDPDHGRMVADMSHGPRRGRLYLVWNDAVDVLAPDQYELFLQYSDDGGKTFSGRLPVDIRTGGKLVATEPVVLSDGTLLVTWYQYFFAMSPKRNDPWPFFVRRSTDGGTTFGPVEHPFDVGPNVWPEPAGDFGGFILPIVTADSSSASRFRDHVYVTWDDVRGGESNIWLVRSTDKGRTWSTPLRLNDNRVGGPVKDYRLKPTVAVNHRGVVAVTWYDRRNDPTRQCWELFVTTSIDGGATFSPNRVVSTAPSCPPPNLAPAVVVNDLTPRPDPNAPPDSVLARMSTVERIQTTGEYLERDARVKAAKGLANTRINVSFQPARSLGFGDYSGLAADVDGIFHALWIDRRGGAPELYTARIALADALGPTSLVDEDVTGRVQVIAGPATFDRASGVTRFTLQLRNLSDRAIAGPITLRIVGINESAGRPSAIMADSAVARRGESVFSFAGKLGTADRLDPLDLSEPITVALKTQSATGWDATLEVRVMGRTAR